MTQVPAQQTQNICKTFVQRWPNAFDVGPTLYKFYTDILCLGLLGEHFAYCKRAMCHK